MQILLANAKLMNKGSQRAPLTTPLFQSVADLLANDMAQLEVEELARELDCNLKIAAENQVRYLHYSETAKMPAIMAYNGQAYKHLRASSLSDEVLLYGQSHLWITSFLYGLLRPMDGIVPYRMEHCVKLQVTDDVPMNRYWQDILTDTLIQSVKADDGILIHLSTEEYEHLFDWKRVCREVRVVHPMFYIRKGTTLKIQSVWAKSCRGAMLRFILKNQLTEPSQLCAFSYEGFEFVPTLGEPDFPHFVREEL